MPAITSDMVKELRDRTSIPMMKCKQALDSCAGDMNAAVDWLRKQGMAAADAKSGRLTANGGIGLAVEGGAGVVVLLACETDFVSGNQLFKEFVHTLATTALSCGAVDADALRTVSQGPMTVTEAIAGKIQQLGESLQLVKVQRLTGPVVVGYNHVGRIGTLVAGTGDRELLRKVALHVASASPAPLVLDRASVDPALIKKEEEIIGATPDVLAKPEAMRPKIVQGRLSKFFKENVLLEQEMLIDGEKGESVSGYAKRHGLTITAFLRISV